MRLQNWNMIGQDLRHLYNIAKIIYLYLVWWKHKKLIILIRNVRKNLKIIFHQTNMLKKIISSRFYENDYNNITKNHYMKNMMKQ